MNNIKISIADIIAEARQIVSPFQLFAVVIVVLIVCYIIQILAVYGLRHRNREIPEFLQSLKFIYFMAILSLFVYGYSIYEKAENNIKVKVQQYDTKKIKYKNELRKIWQQNIGKEFLETELAFEAARFENKHLTVEEIIQEPNKLDIYFEISKNNMQNLINQNYKK